jgi:hypothetical protein
MKGDGCDLFLGYGAKSFPGSRTEPGGQNLCSSDQDSFLEFPEYTNEC